MIWPRQSRRQRISTGAPTLQFVAKLFQVSFHSATGIASDGSTFGIVSFSLCSIAFGLFFKRGKIIIRRKDWNGGNTPLSTLVVNFIDNCYKPTYAGQNTCPPLFSLFSGQYHGSRTWDTTNIFLSNYILLCLLSLPAPFRHQTRCSYCLTEQKACAGWAHERRACMCLPRMREENRALLCPAQIPSLNISILFTEQQKQHCSLF